MICFIDRTCSFTDVTGDWYMEIKILKNASGIFGTIFNGHVLEKSERTSDIDGINIVHYYMHNIDDNVSEELVPLIKKYNIGKIKNCSSSSNFIYFINLFNHENEDNIGTVSIIRYNISEQTMESIHSFDDNIFHYASKTRINLFVINDMYIFMQKEYLVPNLKRTYCGFFKYEIKFLNLKDKSAYDITDDKILKYGISDVLQISDNQCVIKTGFCLLDDNVYNELEQEEASLESISLINIGQLASDLVIGQDNIVLDTIEQAFYTKTIPYIKKQENYLVYTCVDNENKQEEVKFYNLETSEVKSCINQDVIKSSDLAAPYVINGEPYICVTKDNEISFLNLNSGKVDVNFDMTTFSDDTKLQKVLKNSLLFSGTTKKKLIKKSKPFIDLYSFPGKEILFHETGEYADCMETDEGIIYIIEK